MLVQPNSSWSIATELYNNGISQTGTSSAEFTWTDYITENSLGFAPYGYVAAIKDWAPNVGNGYYELWASNSAAYHLDNLAGELSAAAAIWKTGYKLSPQKCATFGKALLVNGAVGGLVLTAAWYFGPAFPYVEAVGWGISAAAFAGTLVYAAVC